MGFGPEWQFPTLSPRRTTVEGRGERIRVLLLHKDTPNTHLCTHVHIAIFVGASQLFTEPLWHRYTLIEVTFVYTDMLTHAHIYPLNGHMVSCVTLHNLPIHMYTYLPPPLLTLTIYMSHVKLPPCTHGPVNIPCMSTRLFIVIHHNPDMCSPLGQVPVSPGAV